MCFDLCVEITRCSWVIESGERYDHAFNAERWKLFSRVAVFSFPCDAEGHVDMDRLSEVGRLNYFYARAMVGHELFAPVTCAAAKELG
jgi:hypothetical protein